MWRRIQGAWIQRVFAPRRQGRIKGGQHIQSSPKRNRGGHVSPCFIIDRSGRIYPSLKNKGSCPSSNISFMVKTCFFFFFARRHNFPLSQTNSLDLPLFGGRVSCQQEVDLSAPRFFHGDAYDSQDTHPDSEDDNQSPKGWLYIRSKPNFSRKLEKTLWGENTND